MGDRMFRLEITQNSVFEVIEFTESELKKRLPAIWDILSRDYPDRLDRAIDILLHGTEKEQPKTLENRPCPAVLEQGVCFAGNSDPSCKICKDNYDKKGTEKEQPSPEDIRRTRGTIVPDGTENEQPFPMDPVLWLKMHGKESDEFGTMIDSHLPPPQPERKSGNSRLVYDKATRTIKQEPPKPTRKEWEEWVDKFPWFYEDDEAEGCANHWTKEVRKWFLTMPGVPKK
jgi:hypothetical protein